MCHIVEEINKILMSLGCVFFSKMMLACLHKLCKFLCAACCSLSCSCAILRYLLSDVFVMYLWRWSYISIERLQLCACMILVVICDVSCVNVWPFDGVCIYVCLTVVLCTHSWWLGNCDGSWIIFDCLMTFACMIVTVILYTNRCAQIVVSILRLHRNGCVYV